MVYKLPETVTDESLNKVTEVQTIYYFSSLNVSVCKNETFLFGNEV